VSRGGRRRGGVVGPSAAVSVAFLVPSLAIACAWLVGQVALDRWWWSQWLFWAPAWPVAIVSAAAALVAWRTIAVGAVRRCSLAVLVLAAAIASARSARYEFGWVPRRAPQSGAIDLTHWNPQWPGERALECGRALAPELGDLTIITTPGSMLQPSVIDQWLPDGFRARGFGTFGLVARLPIVDARMLATATVPGVGIVSVAWVEVLPGAGGPLRILVVDLPSDVRVARGRVADALVNLMRSARVPAAPDLVVGDLNSVPGSVVQQAAAPGFAPAPPWRCSGWMGTYERPWWQLRIDTVLAAGRVEWVSYRTADLGVGKHRAQRAQIRLGQIPRGEPGAGP